ncbi:MAG TPA: methyltransferase [Patescibacteria group bacterium]|nr:methyltransferase [Patescibacteria group bacterium]
MKRGLARWRVRAGYPAGLLYFWLARPGAAWLAAGILLGLAGVVIRALAAGYLRKNEGLATAGPYAWTRNPLYFGSAWIAAGLSLAARSWPAAVVVLAYFLAFYPATMRNEEAGLAAQYGAPFRDYAARVPLFWPRPPRPGPPQAAGRYSWALYRRNREYNAALGMAIVILLLAGKMIFFG